MNREWRIVNSVSGQKKRAPWTMPCRHPGGKYLRPTAGDGVGCSPQRFFWNRRSQRCLKKLSATARDTLAAAFLPENPKRAAKEFATRFRGKTLARLPMAGGGMVHPVSSFPGFIAGDIRVALASTSLSRP